MTGPGFGPAKARNQVCKKEIVSPAGGLRPLIAFRKGSEFFNSKPQILKLDWAQIREMSGYGRCCVTLAERR
jgi:hypothetical protein